MRKILIILSLMVFVLVGCSSAKESSKINLENFKKLDTGMTYEQVVEVLGEGTEEAKTENNGIVITGYRWENEDGSNIGIMFQDNKLISKAQAALE